MLRTSGGGEKGRDIMDVDRREWRLRSREKSDVVIFAVS